MEKETVYNNTLVSGAADETLTYTRYVKDESSGKSTKELLDEKVNKTDQLGTTQIADKAVTTEKLENKSVTTDKLDAASVTTDKVADANITTPKLADSSVETEKINNKAVTTDKLNDGAVVNSKLSPNAVTSEKIKDESVITEKLNDRAVTTEKVEEKAITNTKIGDSAVDGRTISEASVEKKHLANDSVATEKLQDSAITSDKIHTDAVTEEKIKDSSVSNSKLADNSVGTSKIKDGNITNEKVANNTLTQDKLDPELRKVIQAATGLPENLVEVIQDVDKEIKTLHSKDTDIQSQITDKQQQITAHDKDIELLQTRSTQMEQTINNIAATGGASVANTVAYTNTTSGLESVNAQGAIDELAAKNKTQDATISAKANAEDVSSQMQTEQERVNTEFAKKFDKESILQESGDAEDKVMSQKAVSAKLSDLQGNLIIANTNLLLDSPSKGFVHTNGNIFVYPNNEFYIMYPAIPVKEGITYNYVGEVLDNVVYAVAFYSYEGKMLGGLGKNDLSNDYKNGSITAPEGSVFAIISAKEQERERVSFTATSSYYSNFNLNVLEKLGNLIGTKLDKNLIFNNYYSQKTCLEYTDNIPQKGILDFKFYASDNILEDKNITWLTTKLGFYNNLVFIQGYAIKDGKNTIWTIVFEEGVSEQPKGIRVLDGGNLFEFENNTVQIQAHITIDFDIIKGTYDFYGTIHPMSLSSMDYEYVSFNRIGLIQKDVSQRDYPYSDGIKNIITVIPSAVKKSENLTVGLVSTAMSIERKAIEIILGNPIPDSSFWNYFYAKYVDTFGPGNYVAFIRAKRQGTSKCLLQAMDDKGANLVSIDISNQLTDNYKLFSVNVELTKTQSIYVGVASIQSSSSVFAGDVIDISLIGFAKDRTTKSIGSDIYTINDIIDLAKDNDDWNIEKEASMAIFQGIPSVGMIGDSLMSGATYNHYDKENPIKDREGFEWWRVLERESGAKYFDFAKGGLSTKSWLDIYLGTATKPENKCCAYIIGLGVNDEYFLGIDYLGTPDDIDINNPDNNKDTYYGNYAKIIQKLTSFNNRAKFFLLTEPRKINDLDSKWNGAVRYIANLFSNCYTVDLQDLYNDIYLRGFINNTKGPQAHYPSIAYCYMAKLIERAIGDTIIKNAKDFVDIQFGAE